MAGGSIDVSVRYFVAWRWAASLMCCLKGQSAWQLLGMAVCVGVAICALVLGAFAENGAYKVLEQEPLLLDNVFAQELREEYHLVKKRCQVVGVPSTVLFTGALLVLTLSKRGSLPWSDYHALAFLALAIGIGGFALTAGTLERYELLVNNEQHCASLWFKLKRKIKRKMDL